MLSACARNLLIRSATTLLLGLCSGGLLFAAESPPPEAELARINQAIGQIESWLTQANLERPEFEQRLQGAETRIAEIQFEIAASRDLQTELESELAGLAQQQQTLEANKAQQAEVVREMLRAVYMQGSDNAAKVLLNQQDPNEALRLLYYSRRINEESVAKIREYERTLAELERNAKETRQLSTQLAENQQELSDQLRELDAEREARQLMLSALDTAIATGNNSLAGLQADRDALEALVNEVQQAVESLPPTDSTSPFPSLRGELPWPGTGPLLSRFGETYGNAELRRNGLVIGSESGSPVRAVHSGRVVFADWLRGSGLLIIVDHGDGYLSLYGHNETLTRTPGARVAAGETIATAGNTGGQTQTGIYFEIRQNGRPVDPGDWLAPRSSAQN